MWTDVLIVGGGLSGLALADQLRQTGTDFHLVEARDRFGGRIHSPGGQDHGPAWFWPGQPRIARLTRALGLDVFEQFSDGNLVMQGPDGSVRRDMNFATMGGSLRVAGGLGAVVDGLAAQLDPERLTLGTSVTSIAQTDQGVRAKLSDGRDITAAKAVICLPPRLAENLIALTPALPERLRKSLSGTATWMAGQAKITAVYATAFWREMGLSGDGMSRRGPMVELHDASPADLSTGALFGFVGVPVEIRRGREADLKQAALDQLVAMYGPQAAEPMSLTLSDWSEEAFTATPRDAEPLTEHPQYRPIPDQWGGRLVFSGTETAPEFGGFVEGALEAAELAAMKLRKRAA